MVIVSIHPNKPLHDSGSLYLKWIIGVQVKFGPGSVIGIATGYGLDGPEMETR
jgi:hypothetical protein